MTSKHIDEQFKDRSPEETVENIRSILADLGIEMTERHNRSGLENCHSYHISAVDSSALCSNGKGVTEEFSKASAYGEFIERLQCGLFFYKYQSLYTDPAMNLQTYAPDGKYMTMAELVENGEWMDWLIAEYGNGLTREKLAQQCKMYACTTEDRILTVPFYSIFEDKYVYLPAGFIEQMYSANGCCAGNTKEEALVHAFSEIMERRCDISVLLSGESVPIIPDEVLHSFPTVSKILKKLEEEKIYDVTVFDYSGGCGFPVVATRIINKKAHTYLVCAGADPVLELAIQRTLTEIFQGRNIVDFRSAHNGRILKNIADFPQAHNVLNLLETGNGLYALDYFVDGEKSDAAFPDNSNLTNKELLKKMLSMFRSFGKPVYVRNNAFLEFPCFKVIVPGFSESRGLNLTASVQSYAMADQAAKVLRNPGKAFDAELAMMLMFYRSIQTAYSHVNNFARLSGLPARGNQTAIQLPVTLAYAAYRLRRWDEAVKQTDRLTRTDMLSEADAAYFACVKQYLELLSAEADPKKIYEILSRFHLEESVSRLYEKLEQGKTPYEDYLLACTTENCHDCILKNECSYIVCRDVIRKAGERYALFTDGQTKQALQEYL